MIIYKLRNKKTGKFYQGYKSGDTKDGKVFNKKHYVFMSLLGLITSPSYYKKTEARDYEIVTFELKEVLVEPAHLDEKRWKDLMKRRNWTPAEIAKFRMDFEKREDSNEVE